MAKTYKSFLVSGKVQSWGSTGKNVMLYVKSIENKEITTISLTTDTNIQTQASDYVIFAVPENEFNNIISKLETNNKYIIPELNLGFDNKQLVSCFVSQHAVA